MSTEEVIIRCPICNETSPQGYLLCPFCGADLTKTYEAKIFAPVTYKEVWYRFKALVMTPRVISNEIAENPDSKGGFLFIIAIALGLATQLSAYIIHARVLDWKFYPVIFLLGWIFTLILPTLIWFLGSWIIRTMTRLLGGKGNRKQIRAAVGYGLMPVVFVELLIGIFQLIALPWGLDPDPSSFLEIFNAMADLRNSFAGIFGIVLHFSGFLVAGVYIVFILKPASEFSWIEAAISAGVPLLLFTILLITYYVGT
ncbi:MAG: YIP1 family protein [Candidatus Heimdallarchaeota archaeon]